MFKDLSFLAKLFIFLLIVSGVCYGVGYVIDTELFLTIGKFGFAAAAIDLLAAIFKKIFIN